MFFTIVIQYNSQAIYRYDTIAEAKEKFHAEMTYGYNQHIMTTCMVIDKQGAVYKSEVTDFTGVQTQE